MKRIGIVGAGAIAALHADRWKQMPGVELTGYYDIIPEASQRAVDRFGGRVFPSIDELLDSVDIVDICTTAGAHKEPILAAAAAGVPTICEKPLARHLNDCEEIVDAVEESGVPFFVAHVVRFFPQFARAKAVLDSGVLGKPGVIRTIRGGSMPGVRSGWGSGVTNRSYYSDFEQSGGVILDVSIHDLDYVRWCFGEIERVFARGLMFAGRPKDHALITLRFANGAIGHIEGSWAFPPGQFRTRFEIAGSEGILEWDSLDPHPIDTRFSPDENGETPTSPTASPLAIEDDPYYAELAHFVRAVDHGERPSVSARDGMMAVKLSLAAIESQRIGRPVDINTFEESK